MDTFEEKCRQLVNREVLVCLSSLVSTIVADYPGDGKSELAQLSEQAFELATPIDDWESAARDAGWTHETAWFTGAPWFVKDGRRVDYESWQECCEDNDIEPHEREAFEHWAITTWLANKLEAHGEKVDRDFAGLTVWARTTTGQAIYMDSVIEDIMRELEQQREDMVRDLEARQC